MMLAVQFLGLPTPLVPGPVFFPLSATSIIWPIFLILTRGVQRRWGGSVTGGWTQAIIGAFGGSNWSIARFKEANAYAASRGLKPLTILNNNLSLAVMERPVWAGCITSNNAEHLAFLRQSKTTHVSWSSQARGYFLPEALRNRLPADTSPETCFGSPANAERRVRAEKLATNYGVSSHNIATAWVLAQSFPALALVGPRSPGEIATTLPALGIKLTAKEVQSLNLED